MTKIEIHLNDRQREFVEQQVATLALADAGAYLTNLILEKEKAQAMAELEAELLKGLEGPMQEVNDQFWQEIRQRALENIHAKSLGKQ